MPAASRFLSGANTASISLVSPQRIDRRNRLNVRLLIQANARRGHSWTSPPNPRLSRRSTWAPRRPQIGYSLVQKRSECLRTTRRIARLRPCGEPGKPQCGMANAVFTTKPEPSYDDLPELRYHFPSRYLRHAQQALDDWIVYYEPRRRGSHREQPA